MVNKPGAAMAVAADVGRQADVEALVEQVLSSFEQVDLLINNAGECCIHCVDAAACSAYVFSSRS
jgi:NADP-dependent 3-hydroxy acid dehydrogenase YdfG